MSLPAPAPPTPSSDPRAPRLAPPRRRRSSRRPTCGCSRSSSTTRRPTRRATTRAAARPRARGGARGGAGRGPGFGLGGAWGRRNHPGDGFGPPAARSASVPVARATSGAAQAVMLSHGLFMCGPSDCAQARRRRPRCSGAPRRARRATPCRASTSSARAARARSRHDAEMMATWEDMGICSATCGARMRWRATLF